MADVYAKVNGKKVKVGTASESAEGVRTLNIVEEFNEVNLEDISFGEDGPVDTTENEVKVETTKSVAKK